MQNIEPIYYMEKNIGVVTVSEPISETKLITIYLDYVNNFLTVERFAEYYSLTIDSANDLINIGRKLLNN